MSVALLEWWTFALVVPRLSRSEKAITLDECSSIRMVDVCSHCSKAITLDECSSVDI